jgi:hypothetical protein
MSKIRLTITIDEENMDYLNQLGEEIGSVSAAINFLIRDKRNLNQALGFIEKALREEK